jgi:hypothetical protein
MRQQALKGSHRFLGAVLLPERKRTVDNNHSEDRSPERCHTLAGHLRIGDQGKDRRNPQKKCKKVGELREESAEERRRREPFDTVGTELDSAGSRLSS